MAKRTEELIVTIHTDLTLQNQIYRDVIRHLINLMVMHPTDKGLVK